MATQEKTIVSGRAKQVLAYLVAYKTKRGLAPSYREIGAACNINSTSLVSSYLGQLERAGYVKRFKDVARGISILKEVGGDEETQGRQGTTGTEDLPPSWEAR